MIEEATRLLKGSSLLFAGTMAGNVLNVLYIFLMARLLTPPQYASLVALVSLSVVVGMPSGTIQAVAVRLVAAGREDDHLHARGVVTALFGWVSLAGAAITVAISLLSGWLGTFLRLESVLPILLFAPSLGMGLVLPLLRGVLQGQQAFVALAVLGLLDVVLKVVLGVGLVWAGLGVGGAITGLLLSSTIGIGLTIAVMRLSEPAAVFALESASQPTAETASASAAESGVLPDAPASTVVKDAVRLSLPTLLILGGLYAMATLDTVLVKHFFAPEAAGIYAGLSVIGRSLFWASGAVTTVFLPIVSRATERAGSGGAGDARRTLWLALAIMAALCLAGQTLFWLAPGQIVNILFGSAYAGAAPLLVRYGWGATCLALANVALCYHLGAGRLAASVISPLCAVLQVVLVSLFHQSISEVVTVLIVANATLLIAAVASALIPPRQHARTRAIVALGDGGR